MASVRVIVAGVCDADRRLLRYALAGAGDFSVSEAETVDQVTSLLRENKPTLLVLDLLSWPSEAIRAAANLRRNPETRSLPILMFGDPKTSGNPEADSLVEARWYPRKGFQVASFIEQVRALAAGVSTAAARTESQADRSAALTEDLVLRVLAEHGPPTPFEFSLIEMATTLCPKGREIEHVAEFAEHDPLLALALLSWTHEQCPESRIGLTSVHDAVKLIGPKKVYQLTEGLSPWRWSNASLWEPGFFWVHSMATARIAGMLSRRLGLGTPAEASTAGLFSGLGYFVLARFFPRHFGELMRAGWGADSVSCEWEERTVGAHHGRLAAWMLKHFHLPVVLQEVAEHHHDYEDRAGASMRSSSRLLCMLVHAAEQIADALFHGDPPLTPLAPLSGSFLDALNDSSVAPLQILDEAHHAVADLLTEMLHLFPQSESRSAYHRTKPLGKTAYWAPKRPDVDLVHLFLEARSQEVVEMAATKDSALRDISAMVINLAYLTATPAAQEAVATLAARDWLRGRKLLVLLNKELPETWRSLAPHTCRFIVLPAHPARWIRWLVEPTPKTNPNPAPQLRIA